MPGLARPALAQDAAPDPAPTPAWDAAPDPAPTPAWDAAPDPAPTPVWDTADADAPRGGPINAAAGGPEVPREIKDAVDGAVQGVSNAFNGAVQGVDRFVNGAVNTVKQVINAQVFFAARTFQNAVVTATTNIFQAEIGLLYPPLKETVDVFMFRGQALFGEKNLPDAVKTTAEITTNAAVPIWALSLVMFALAVLTRNAAGMGYGSGDVAEGFIRWLLIAFASANAIWIINLAHNGFQALGAIIIDRAGAVSADQFVNQLLPLAMISSILPGVPLLILVLITIAALIFVIVLGLAYVARYVLLLAVAALGPLAIACEGIPFTRFIFRDWLSLFVKLELLHIINVTILGLGISLGKDFFPSNVSVASIIITPITMIGLASALIGVNLNAFKQVFGSAIQMGQQALDAVGKVVATVALVAGGAAIGAATGVPVAAAAGAGLNSGSGSTPPLPNAALNPSGGPAGSSGSGGQAFGSAAPTPTSGGGGPGGGGSTPPPLKAASNNSGGQASDGPAATQANGSDRRGGTIMKAIKDIDGETISRIGQVWRSEPLMAIGTLKQRAERQAENQNRDQRQKAERLARDTGATNSEDIEAITEAIMANGNMMEGYRRVAPTLRAMSRLYGGPSGAAAIAGYSTFAALADDMAREVMGLPSAGGGGALNQSPSAGGGGALNQSPSAGGGGGTGPLARWLAQPPGLTDPEAQNITPYDYAVGLRLAQNIGASPDRAPLWARTVYSLRRAYGQSFVDSFLQRAQDGEFKLERDAMEAIDNQVDRQIGNAAVSRFWRPNPYTRLGGEEAGGGKRVKKRQ